MCFSAMLEGCLHASIPPYHPFVAVSHSRLSLLCFCFVSLFLTYPSFGFLCSLSAIEGEECNGIWALSSPLQKQTPTNKHMRRPNNKGAPPEAPPFRVSAVIASKTLGNTVGSGDRNWISLFDVSHSFLLLYCTMDLFSFFGQLHLVTTKWLGLC